MRDNTSKKEIIYEMIYSSWPYISGELHLGRLIGSFIPADCYRRLLSERGIPSFHFSGLDCFGEKNISDIDKKIFEVKYKHSLIFKKLDIELEQYGTTSANGFKKFATENLLRLLDNDIIKYRKVKYPYCEICNLEVRTILEGKCNTCKNPIIDKDAKRYVIRALTSKPNSRQSYEEVERNAFTPGLASPFTPNKKIWVWIEALHGYAYLSQNYPHIKESYFYGLDNEYFHKSLLPVLFYDRSSQPIRRKHYVSCYLLSDCSKMSGSVGNFLTIDQFPNEEAVLRLYLLSYNLTKTSKNFDKDGYINFKTWVVNRILPLLDKKILVDDFQKIKELNFYHFLYQQFLNSKTFSTIVRLLQSLSSRLTEKDTILKINCIIKILSPGLFDYKIENK